MRVESLIWGILSVASTGSVTASDTNMFPLVGDEVQDVFVEGLLVGPIDSVGRPGVDL